MEEIATVVIAARGGSSPRQAPRAAAVVSEAWTMSAVRRTCSRSGPSGSSSSTARQDGAHAEEPECVERRRACRGIAAKATDQDAAARRPSPPLMSLITAKHDAGSLSAAIAAEARIALLLGALIPIAHVRTTPRRAASRSQVPGREGVVDAPQRGSQCGKWRRSTVAISLSAIQSSPTWV